MCVSRGIASQFKIGGDDMVIFDWFFGLLPTKEPSAKEAAYLRQFEDPRKDLKGAAMTPGMARARALAEDPNIDPDELAWFACEATDDEWDEYCRAADALVARTAVKSIWPRVAADGAVIDIGFVAGK